MYDIMYRVDGICTALDWWKTYGINIKVDGVNSKSINMSTFKLLSLTTDLRWTGPGYSFSAFYGEVTSLLSRLRISPGWACLPNL